MCEASKKSKWLAACGSAGLPLLLLACGSSLTVNGPLPVAAAADSADGALSDVGATDVAASDIVVHDIVADIVAAEVAAADVLLLDLPTPDLVAFDAVETSGTDDQAGMADGAGTGDGEGTGDGAGAVDAADPACPAGTVCDDDNSCTTDYCEPGKGCVFAPNDKACDDGVTCTFPDVCKAGKCAGPVIDCAPNSSCVESIGCACDTGYSWDGQKCIGPCGNQEIAIDVDGTIVCAKDYPAWGTRPLSPPASLFKDNGDGTVTDSQTNLQWQQVASIPEGTWEQARASCQDLTLGGKSDWRLPTAEEWLSIVDYAGPSKLAAGLVVPLGNQLCWTAGRLGKYSSMAWQVNHGGSLQQNYAFNKACVRCVR